MEIYSTEEQQVEALKRFWKEYGVSIIGGAALGLGGLFGWNAWQDHQQSQQEAASAAFAELMQNTSSTEQMQAAAETFRTEHNEAGYNALVDLMQARVAVDSGDLSKAETLLKDAVAKLDSSTRPLAQLRLARVQAAQEELAAAQATLAAIDNEAFAALRDELKGDLLKQQGDLEGARAAYESAMQAGGAMASPALQLKLDGLAQAS
ncbi:YfgM family protein [Ferrimonas gelatinilytica]|uniref:Ancillary SecYEG translocon subunit n=1 Tax=Ferrimonas gelatinilytica TaxID=1255257 RepID=A0ABP9S6L4_9GAMM